MQRRPVLSREYKVMLRPGRFNGDETTLLRTAGAVWSDFCTQVADVALGTKGDLAAVTSRRVISFFDTATRHLNPCHYIFRERRDVESRRRETTLKLAIAIRISHKPAT
jgi:hypothetical protein